MKQPHVPRHLQLGAGAWADPDDEPANPNRPIMCVLGATDPLSEGAAEAKAAWLAGLDAAAMRGEFAALARVARHRDHETRELHARNTALCEQLARGLGLYAPAPGFETPTFDGDGDSSSSAEA